MPEKETVFIVGAGPGDFGLLTLRAKELIEKCDILIYDNLVNPHIVSLAKESCERIYAGKSGSSHTMEQDEINSLIAEKAALGKTVVRLKGGDPFIFGRGGEEALFLHDKGIRFEIVCGVSSAYAVPAYAGIPVTQRGLASSVAFITGHEDPSKETSDIRWDRLATGVQTLVFLMGVKNLPFIAEQLIKNGRDKNTPAAVIQNGTFSSQRTVAGTLENIFDRASKENITPPSIIVVGDVVSLREKIGWFETRPLFGRTIVVTRAREQASILVQKLMSLGAGVIELPTIKIMPPADVASIRAAIKDINSYNWIIFTSVNGVSYFFKYLTQMEYDARILRGIKICAIGPATADKLREYFIKPDFVPERFTSADVVQDLEELNEIKNKSFLLPRADIAPDELRESLLARGAALVDDLAVYRTVEQDIADDAPLVSLMKNHEYDMVTFTSSSTAMNFKKLLDRLEIPVSEKIKCAAIGPVTAKTLKEIGFNADIVAEEFTIDGLVKIVIKYFSG